jgi:hypothetical protein
MKSNTFARKIEYMLKKTVFVLFTASVTIMSCKKDEVVYTPPDSSFGLIYTKIFTPSCAFADCHANEDHGDLGHAHGITLEGVDTYSYLINKAPKNIQAVKAGLSIVVPNDTLNSFLLHKIDYTNSPYKFGAPMPGGGLFLTKNQITFVKQWILAGAPLEGHVADKSLMN